jgi:hypothetical protein
MTLTLKNGTDSHTGVGNKLGRSLEVTSPNELVGRGRAHHFVLFAWFNSDRAHAFISSSGIVLPASTSASPANVR